MHGEGIIFSSLHGWGQVPGWFMRVDKWSPTERPRGGMSSYHKRRTSQGVSGSWFMFVCLLPCRSVCLCMFVCDFLKYFPDLRSVVPHPAPWFHKSIVELSTSWHLYHCATSPHIRVQAGPTENMVRWQRRQELSRWVNVYKVTWAGLQGWWGLPRAPVWEMKLALRKKEMAKQEGWVSSEQSQRSGECLSKAQHTGTVHGGR